MATLQRQASADVGPWVKQGAVGGVIAGIVFAMFEMIMAAVLGGADTFFMPLRMIGAIVLGMKALDPGYSLVTAGMVGLMVHMMLSIMFGIIFAALVAYVPGLANSSLILIVAASVYGFALWIVNFYVIAHAAGWLWFPDKTNVAVQFVAHTIMFGTVLGLFLDRTHARDATT